MPNEVAAPTTAPSNVSASTNQGVVNSSNTVSNVEGGNVSNVEGGNQQNTNINTSTNFENQTDNNQQETRQSPENIDQAYQLLVENDKQRFANNVQNNDAGNEQANTNTNQQEQANASEQSNVGEQIDQGNNNDTGRLSDQQYQARIDAYERQVSSQINQEAQRLAAEQLQKDNIRQIGLNDLQYYDERLDRVLWRNPTDKNNPYTNLRDATDFIDIYNKQVNQRFNTEVRKQTNDLVNRARPQIELQRFAQVYNNLSKDEQAVCNALTADKAIYGNDNKTIVGFNVNYANIVNQAKTIVQMIKGNDAIQNAGQQDTQQDNNNVNTNNNSPALDMNTSNNNNNVSEKIKLNSVNNAYKYLMQQEAEKNGRR